MRRSHKTNTLVIVSDHTKSLYDDKWFADELHYIGMGSKWNQSLDFRLLQQIASITGGGRGSTRSDASCDPWKEALH